MISTHRLRKSITTWGLVFAFTAAVHAQAPGETKKGDAPATTKPRYRMPAFMVVTHVDWPKDATLREQMAEFLSTTGFSCVEAEADLLDACRKHGIYVRLGGEPGKLLGMASKLKDDPAVFAYFISDRRRRSSFPTFARWVQLFEKEDPNHPTMFINRANWNEFTAFADEVRPTLLDFYHYHWQPRRHPERYWVFLMMFRGLGQKHGIPVMRCVDAGQSPERIRYTMYTSAAYGVQGFHFWTPWHVGHKKNEKGEPVLENGRIVPTMTPWGKEISDVGKALKMMAPTLLPSRSVATYHTDPLPIGGQKVPEGHWFKPGGKHTIVGHFEGEKKNNALLVVNGDAGTKRDATISFSTDITSIERMDKKTGEWIRLETKIIDGRQSVQLSLRAGDGELLRPLKKTE